MSTSFNKSELTPNSKLAKKDLFFKNSSFYVSIVILILSLFYYLSYASYGFSDSDWGAIVDGAERFLQGDVFYKDFNIGYTPGIYLYTALAFKIFGVKLWSATVAWSIIRAFNCLLIYLLGTKILSRKVAFFLPLILLLIPGPLHKGFLIFFGLLHLLIFLKLLSTDNKGFYLFSGIVAGISLIFRIDLFVSFVITLLLVEVLKSINPVPKITRKSQFLRSLKNFSFFSGGVIFALVPFALYLLSNSAVSDAINQNLFFLGAAKSRMFLLPPIKQMFSWGRWDFINYVVVLIPLGIGFVFLALIFSNIRTKQFGWEDKKLLILFLYGLLFLHQILRWPWIGRLYQILPPFLIIDIYLISKYFFNHGKRRFNKFRLIYPATLTVTNFALLTLIIGSLTMSDMDTNNSIFIRRTNTALLSTPKATVFTTPEQAEKVRKIINIIETETEKDEYIYIVQYHSMYYFLTERKNATRYYFIEAYVFSDEKQLEVVRNLEDKKVNLIISAPNYPGTPEATIVKEYINRHYHVKETIGDKIIYLKNDRQGSVSKKI